MRSGARMPSPSVPLRPAIASASSAGGSRRHRPDLPRPEGATEKLAALVEQALPVFQAAGDDLALYVAYSALAEVADMRAQMDAALEAHERAVRTTLGRRATHRPGSSGCAPIARFVGTTPVSELLAWLDENEARAGRDHFLRAYRAGALAMLGRFDEARAILAETRAELAERGGGSCSRTSPPSSPSGSSSGPAIPPPQPSSEQKGAGCTRSLGEQGFLSAAAANLAQALYALDRLDEADAWADRAAELGASDDADKQMLWRQVKAKVLARRGEHAEAERLAREAVAICDETDMLDAQGDVYADLAEVLCSPAARRKQPKHSSRRSSATSARGTSFRRSARKRVSPSFTKPRRDERRSERRTSDHVSSTTRSARPAARIVFAWSSVHSRPSTITLTPASFRIRSAYVTR